MSVVALDHINIATTRLEETRAFYCDVLGLVEGYRPNFAVAGYWLYAGDKPIIHLQRAEADSQVLAAVRHFALEVSDLERLTTRFSALGVSHRSTQTPDGAIHQVFLTDPRGTQVELSYRSR